MSRPSDWHVLDLAEDPTPGSPYRVRQLAQKFLALSADAFEAAAEVRRLAGDDGVVGWLGEAGRVFGGTVDELPGQLDKLDASYGVAGRALHVFAGELDTAQSQADAALTRGREARMRLLSAQDQLEAATAAVTTATGSAVAAGGVPTLSTYATYSALPASWSGHGSNPPLPDASEIAAATRAHDAAVTHLGYVNALVSDARSDVDTERRLALAAQEVRERAAQTCRAEIDRASDAGIQNRGFWGAFSDVVANAWDRVVHVAKAVVIVAGIVAAVVGGPLAWIAFAAALILLADALQRYATGEATLWDVGFAVLQCIPCTTGLTTVAGLGRGVRAAASGLRGGFVAGGALARGTLTAGAARLTAMAAAVRSGVATGVTTIFRRSMMGGRHHELEGIVDVAFGSSFTRIGADRQSVAVANYVRSLDGYHDVVIHGSPDGFIPLGPAQLVNPAHVAETIFANPNYVPGTPVRALSCWTGKNGEGGPAQQLADQLQVEVLAPTVKAGISSSTGVHDAVLGVANRVVDPGTVVRLGSGEEVVAEWVRLIPRSGPGSAL